MDADDLSHPERLARQVAYLDAHADCLAVGSWVSFIDAEGKAFDLWKTPESPEAIYHQLESSNVLGHGAATLRRAALEKVGGYDETYRYAQDYDLWLRLSEQGDLANLPEPLYSLRFWGGAISTAEKTNKRRVPGRRVTPPGKGAAGVCRF